MLRSFKGLIIIISLLLVSCSTSGLPESSSADIDLDVVHTQHRVEVQNVLGDVFEVFDAHNLTLSEQRARQAAVKVRSLLEDGHGSGTYMVAYGRRIVATAAHVVRSESTVVIDGRNGESVIGKVVFVDDDIDIAFIVVPEMETRTAIKYRPQTRYDERIIGTNITYTGFPSHHDLLTIRGYVSSTAHKMIVSNMFAWFGSSGSGVFDQRGRYLGCVSGVDIGRFGFGLRVPLEDVVWIAPVSQVDQDLLKTRILSAEMPGIIKSFPGAAAPRRGGLRD